MYISRNFRTRIKREYNLAVHVSCSLQSSLQSIAIKDNDSLAAMLAANIQADLLILMSDVDGIYNKPPWEDGARMMSTYTSSDRNTIQFGQKSKVRRATRLREFYFNHAIV